MYCYVLDKSKMDWIESESLFLHDIALLLENTEKKAYLYAGPKSSKKEQEMGVELAQGVVQKFGYEFIPLGSTVPLKIQAEIDLLLGENIDPRTYKVERTFSIVSSTVLAVLGWLAFSAVAINNLRMFGWKTGPLEFGTDLDTFTALFNLSHWLLWVAIGCFGAQVLTSLFTKRIFLIVVAIVSTAISVGAMLYLNKGEFLFAGAPALITRGQLLLHYLWLSLAYLAVSGAVVWVVLLFFRHTEPKKRQKVDLDEIRKASRPTILQDKPPVEMKEIEKQ